MKHLIDEHFYIYLLNVEIFIAREFFLEDSSSKLYFTFIDFKL